MSVTKTSPAMTNGAPDGVAVPVQMGEQMREQIRARLAVALPGAEIVVADDSDRHAGHAGVRERGGGHYRVQATWTGFAAMDRLARHRLVHDALAELVAGGKIHALQLMLRTPVSVEAKD